MVLMEDANDVRNRLNILSNLKHTEHTVQYDTINSIKHEYAILENTFEHSKNIWAITLELNEMVLTGEANDVSKTAEVQSVSIRYWQPW